MKTCCLTLGLGAGLVLLTNAWLSITVAEETNVYLSITERNPFGLKPPPPPPAETPPPAPPAPPAATIKLTGITSIIGPPKALFEITEPGPGKTPRKPILAENERDGDLEVVSINIGKSEVTIRNAGAVTNITFTPIETAATAPATPGKPGGPALPVPPPPRAGTTAVSPVDQGGPTIISRNPPNTTSSRNSVTVLGGGPEYAATAAPQATAPRVGPTYNAAATAEAANRLRNIPSRTIRTNPHEADGAGQPPPGLTPDQLARLREAQKLMYEAQGDPRAKIMPP